MQKLYSQGGAPSGGVMPDMGAMGMPDMGGMGMPDMSGMSICNHFRPISLFTASKFSNNLFLDMFFMMSLQ